jgi:hypothetical protein
MLVALIDKIHIMNLEIKEGHSQALEKASKLTKDVIW